jgi:ATP-dependent Clp protease ATP-binding subunit ClpA
MGRIIRDYIKKPLANEILFGKLANGGSVRVQVAGEDLAFAVAPKDA